MFVNMSNYTKHKDLEVGFLGYVRNWEQHVAGLEGYAPGQKETMLLNQQTREGIKISGTYYIFDLVYLMTLIYKSILVPSTFTVYSFVGMGEVL